MRKLIFSLLAICVLFGVQEAWAVDPTFETWTNKSGDTGRKGVAVRGLKLGRLASRDASVG